MDSKLPKVPENRNQTYSKPQLRKYGHLAQVTSAIGDNGMMDGGVGVDKTEI